jgi:enoyl-CoA hydratase/carnithine racemase
MVLTISNPEHRNALGPEMYAAGVEALNVAETNPEVRSVVISGEGAMFCAGGNLQRLAGNRQQPPEVQARSIEGLHSWIDAVRTFPKPVIAAVEGAAAGAGFSLCLACDFIVAAQDAFFVMAYSNVALSPDGGATWHLARMLPRQFASELLMAGERIGAPRLHAGSALVNPRPVRADARRPRALALAEQLNATAAERRGQHQGTHPRGTWRPRQPAARERARPVREEPATCQWQASASRGLPGASGAALRLAERATALPQSPSGRECRRRANERHPVPRHSQLRPAPILTLATSAGAQLRTAGSRPLSPSLRHDILRCAYVKRYQDGELIAAAGDPPRNGSPAPRARCA